MARFNDPIFDNNSISGDLLPSEDNVYVLGNADYRWKSISIGEGTIYINDAVTNDVVAMTIADGVFFLDGIAQAQLPHLKVVDITYDDNSVQTSAALQPDWNQSNNTKMDYIKNKPDLSTVGVPVEVDFTVNGGTVGGTQPTFNGAPLFDGSYVEHGPLVFFRINVDFTNITGFGTGQYFVELPFAAKYDTTLSTGHLHDVSTNNDYVINGEVEAGSTTLKLSYIGSNGQNQTFTSHTPITLTIQDSFHVSGTYIAA